MKTKALFAAIVIALVASAAFGTPRSSVRKKVLRAHEISSMFQSARAQLHPTAQGSVDSYIRRIQQERDPALYKMGVFSLLKYKMPLTRDQKKTVLKMIREPTRGLLPKAPPIPAEGTIEIRHYSMNGFMAADLKQMKNAGFAVKEIPGGAVATRGRMNVLVRETHRDILRDLHDSKVNMIVYNGHSQIGGTVEQALLQESMRQPRGRKLIALFQCVGTQTLPMLKGRVPNNDVITSKTQLYVNEIPDLVTALYQGVEKGESYHALRRRLDKAGWGKNRLVFPNQTASLDHTDFDVNGILDINQVAGKIQVLPGKQRKVAKSLMSGVHFLRTMNPYYVEKTSGAVFNYRQAKVPVVAKGLSTSNGVGVTNIRDTTVNGQRRFEVSVNEPFKSAPRHVVGAASVFELQMHLQKTLAGKNDDRAKIRALAFTGEYLGLIPRNRAKAQEALDRVTQMNGLPRLSLYRVQSAISGEDVISEKQVDRLQRLVNQAGGR